RDGRHANRRRRPRLECLLPPRLPARVRLDALGRYDLALIGGEDALLAQANLFLDIEHELRRIPPDDRGARAVVEPRLHGPSGTVGTGFGPLIDAVVAEIWASRCSLRCSPCVPSRVDHRVEYLKPPKSQLVIGVEVTNARHHQQVSR